MWLGIKHRNLAMLSMLICVVAGAFSFEDDPDGRVFRNRTRHVRGRQLPCHQVLDTIHEDSPISAGYRASNSTGDDQLHSGEHDAGCRPSYSPHFEPIAIYRVSISAQYLLSKLAGRAPPSSLLAI
jgi:hypothetical protein